MADVDELAVGRQLLSVLEKRIRLIKQAAPAWQPSQRNHYILQLPVLEHNPDGVIDELADGLGETTPVISQARLGSDAALVVQKILLVSSAPLATILATQAAGNTPFFDLIDRASGGRSLVESQRGNTLTSGLPITHFANTQPAGTRGACYSFFTLPSEYLLAKGAVVEARLFRELSQQCSLRIALAGYKVYG